MWPQERLKTKNAEKAEIDRKKKGGKTRENIGKTKHNRNLATGSLLLGEASRSDTRVFCPESLHGERFIPEFTKHERVTN